MRTDTSTIPLATTPNGRARLPVVPLWLLLMTALATEGLAASTKNAPRGLKPVHISICSPRLKPCPSDRPYGRVAQGFGSSLDATTNEGAHPLRFSKCGNHDSMHKSLWISTGMNIRGTRR